MYKNIEYIEIEWCSYGSETFTVDKYKELDEKYSNTESVNMNIHNILELNITKGNVEIKRKLKAANKKSRKIERKFEIESLLNNTSNKSIVSEIEPCKLTRTFIKKRKVSFDTIQNFLWKMTKKYFSNCIL